MKYFSMFSGIGGFDLALNRQGHQCVGYSEINEYSIKIYKKNFGDEAKNYGDATKIDADTLPDFDLLCGGFPCQAFSIAGKRRGFEDTRGTLFFDIARIIKVKRPSAILLENVKGLLSHDEGRTFGTIITTLDELGYDIQWMVLNSKFFGVPQNRERVFIIGNLRGLTRPEILPFARISGETKELVYAQKSDREIARVYSAEGIAPTLHLKSGGWQEPKIATMLNQIATKRSFETPKEINQFLRLNKREYTLSEIAERINLPKTQVEHYFRVDGSRAIPSPDIWIRLKAILEFDDSYDRQVTEIYEKEIEFEQTRRVYDTNHPSPTLNATQEPKIQSDDMSIRRLTPIECERLQGFPDDWTEGVSDTRRYNQLGNAVTVNVVEAILKKWFLCI